MKNFENIGGYSGLAVSEGTAMGGASCGVTRNGALDAVHDDLVGRREPRRDHPQAADQRAGGHALLLHRVLIVDDEDEGAALVGADRGIGHQEGVLVLAERHPDTDEHAGQKREVRVRHQGAGGERAGIRIHRRGHIVERTDMGIARLGLQADIDGDVMDLAQQSVASAELRLDTLHDRLADREVHVDRLDLHNGGELGQLPGGADHLPDGDEMGRHLAVERRLHLGIGVVDGGELRAGDGIVEIGLGGIPFRLGLVEIGLGIDVLLTQGRLALIGLLRLDQLGLHGGLLRLGLLQLGEIRRRLDGEERRPLGDHRAVDIVLAVEEALDAGDEIDRIHRGDAAGGIEIARHVMDQRGRDAHLWRRWSDIGIGFLAACERQAQPERHQSRPRNNSV
jgi:hypothetical protein